MRLSRIVSTPLSLSSAGLHGVAVLGDETLQLLAQRGDVARDLIERRALALQLGQQRVGVADRLTTWSLRSASTVVALLALASRPRSSASRSLRVCENRATPSTAIFSSRRGLGEGFRQHPQRIGQLVGVQAADRRRQIAERVGQLIRRGGAVHRNRALLLAVAARGDLEDLGTQQALGLDRRLGAITEPDVLVDGELDQHPRPVEFDGL